MGLEHGRKPFSQMCIAMMFFLCRESDNLFTLSTATSSRFEKLGNMHLAAAWGLNRPKSKSAIFDRFLETGGYDRPRFVPLIRELLVWAAFFFILAVESLVFGACRAWHSGCPALLARCHSQKWKRDDLAGWERAYQQWELWSWLMQTEGRNEFVML